MDFIIELLIESLIAVRTLYALDSLVSFRVCFQAALEGVAHVAACDLTLEKALSSVLSEVLVQVLWRVKMMVAR